MPDKARVTVYINPTTSQQFRDVAGYRLADGSPAIDVVCLFAANYAASEQPYLRANNDDPPTTNPFNQNIQTVLEDGSVDYLRGQGLTVLLTITNGLHSVGWSQFTLEKDAEAFAQYLQSDIVEKYRLSGIDIDDEYSKGDPNDTSLVMVTTKMRSRMPEIVISKALFADAGPFAATWNGHTLAQNLSYGAEMSYWEQAQYRLPPYTSGRPAANCLAPSQVSCGFWANQSSDPDGDVKWLKDKEHRYAGVMVFGFEDQANVDLTERLVNDWYGPGNWNVVSRRGR